MAESAPEVGLRSNSGSAPASPPTTEPAQPAAPNPTDDVQIDPHDASDTDSALGDGSASATSASLSSSVLDYQYENGRRYHAFREGEYMLPNDEQEQNRMDLHHHIFRLTLAGGLTRAPIKDAHRVLDMGTGTGIWCIDFADEHPASVVVGNDLSPIQPSWIPPNCKFIIDDIESDWTYKPAEAFDYIHGRGLGGSVRDWDRLYRQIYENLNPGGWVEMQEYEAWVRSDDDPELINAPTTAQWQQLVDEASVIFGKKVNIAERLKGGLIEAGFEDVKDDVYKVPIGTWPLHPKLKELGLYQREQMCDAVEPFSLAFLTRILKWSKEETEILVAKVRNEFRDKRLHMYIAFHFVYGRKPVAR